MATTGVYNNAKTLVAEKRLDWVNDDIRVLLVDGSFEFDPSHVTIADALAQGSELTGPEYMRKTLLDKSVSDRAVYRAAPVVWDSADFGTPDAAIVFRQQADDGISELICCVDLNPKIRTNTGNYQAVWGPSGIARII